MRQKTLSGQIDHARANRHEKCGQIDISSAGGFNKMRADRHRNLTLTLTLNYRPPRDEKPSLFSSTNPSSYFQHG